MRFPNCYCNICGVPIYKRELTINQNFCGDGCKSMMETFRRKDFHMEFNYARKAKLPVALRMEMEVFERGSVNTLESD